MVLDHVSLEIAATQQLTTLLLPLLVEKLYPCRLRLVAVAEGR